MIFFFRDFRGIFPLLKITLTTCIFFTIYSLSTVSSMNACDYHNKLTESLYIIEKAIQSLERGKYPLSDLNKILPESVEVENSFKEKIPVKNYWLKREAEKYASSDIPGKILVLRRVKGRIEAILSLPQESLNTDRKDIKSKMELILSAKQFKDREQVSLKDKIRQWFLSISFVRKILTWLESFEFKIEEEKILFYLLLAIASLIVASAAGFFIVLIKRSFRKNLEEFTGVKSSDPGVPSFWEKKAKEVAAEGNYRKALGNLLFALLVYFDRKGLIAFEPSKTSREYLKSLESMEHVRIVEYFEPFCNIYETKWYGLQDCNEEEYKKALEFFNMCLGRKS